MCFFPTPTITVIKLVCHDSMFTSVWQTYLIFNRVVCILAELLYEQKFFCMETWYIVILEKKINYG